jgi:hypothetical protein
MVLSKDDRYVHYIVWSRTVKSLAIRLRRPGFDILQFNADPGSPIRSEFSRVVGSPFCSDGESCPGMPGVPGRAKMARDPGIPRCDGGAERVSWFTDRIGRRRIAQLVYCVCMLPYRVVV